MVEVVKRLMRRLRALLRPDPVQSVAEDGAKIKNLIESINESAKQASAIILTFLATVIYIAITAASTTDEQLLINSPLTLPLFNVGLPTAQFYGIAAPLVVFLHLNLLLQEYFIAYRIYRLPARVRLSEAAAEGEEADDLFIIPSVIMRLPRRHNRLVRFLSRLVFVAVTVALPAAVLILIQVKFLPYHDHLITLWHRIFTIGDVLLALTFFWMRPWREGEEGYKQHFLWTLEAVSFSVIAIAFMTYSMFIAVIPESCEPSPFADLFSVHRNLHLTEMILSSREPSQELLSGLDKDESAIDSLWRKYSRGLRLSKRDFRCADFSRSKLVNADFRGSRLEGANFLGANLRGSNFSPLGNPAEVVGVTSLLPEKEQEPTQLENANFTHADLREANFQFAQLAGVHFENAFLQGADLSFANLNGARLAEAQLFAADLKEASLRGASFQGARLEGANLASAKAEFAVFTGAVLEGAELSSIRAMGAQFMQASLQGATGLPLEGVDLRQAMRTSPQKVVGLLLGVDLRQAKVGCFALGVPRYSDLRDIDIREQPWSKIEELEKGLPGRPSEKARERLVKARSARPCSWHEEVPPPPDDSDRWSEHVLYSRQQLWGPLQGWPEPAVDEESFQEDFAAALMKQACLQDESFRLALEQRVLERLTVDPGDSLARKLVHRLRREILSPTCDPPLDFQGHEAIKRGILRRFDP